MRIIIIIPAHNEEKTIGLTLNALVNQTFLPKQVVVVNDNSSDNTPEIVEAYTFKYPWITLVDHKSTDSHIPGSKVIHAFYKGYETINADYDIICKFDADIILPDNYLETLTRIFESDPKVGIAGGLAFIKDGDDWVYEDISNKSHVRGPFKAYRKACFNDIGGLKESIGWDTVDTLLANFYGWKMITDQTLHVKHLKPTGAHYNKASRYLQGEAMYKMRYGFIITVIAALKIAYKKRNIIVLKNYIIGFLRAQKNKASYLVTKEQGKYIRRLRWKGIRNKLN